LHRGRRGRNITCRIKKGKYPKAFGDYFYLTYASVLAGKLKK